MEPIFTITNPKVEIDRLKLNLNSDSTYTYYEGNSTYYKKLDDLSFYIHSFILTADESSIEELKVDISFNIKFKNTAPPNIELFLIYNLPTIFQQVHESCPLIPERLRNLEIFRQISYSYSSVIDPIKHIIPLKS